MVADEYDYRCESVNAKRMVEIPSRPETLFLQRIERADKSIKAGKDEGKVMEVDGG